MTYFLRQKIRNTARFLLGNLYDFNPARDAVFFEDLPELDKYMLHRMTEVFNNVTKAFDNYQFFRFFQTVQNFCVVDLSNFYLDVAKDRLYISVADSYRRRSCQTVLQIALENLARAIGPVLCHMAEDIWQNLPYEKTTESVFEGGWPKELMSFSEHDAEQWDMVRSLRDDVNKVLELARSDKLVGASLDAAAYVYVPDEETRAVLDKLDGDRDLITPPQKTNGVDELRTTLMLSQVSNMNVSFNFQLIATKH